MKSFIDHRSSLVEEIPRIRHNQRPTTNHQRRLTLIRPNLGDYRSSDAMPPLAMGILAARAPGWDVEFYDEKAEAVPIVDTDLVALSVETFTARRAYAIADAYRARGVTVVMGGYHLLVLKAIMP